MTIWSSDLDDKVDSVFGAGRDAGRAKAAARSGPAADLTRVPRPVYGRKAGRIDLSAAPSSMEEHAKRWSGR